MTDAANHQALLLSTVGQTLISILGDPEATVEELAKRLDVSTRTIRRSITELESAGVLTRQRVANRNRYELNRSIELAPGTTVMDFAALLAGS